MYFIDEVNWFYFLIAIIFIGSIIIFYADFKSEKINSSNDVEFYFSWTIPVIISYFSIIISTILLIVFYFEKTLILILLFYVFLFVALKVLGIRKIKKYKIEKGKKTTLH